MNEDKSQNSGDKPQSKGISKGAIIAIVAVVVIVAILYVGQKFLARKIGEGIVEKTIESQTGADVDINGEGIKIENEEGTFEVNASAEWPADIPADVPEFTFGTITGVIKNSQQPQGWSVMAKDVTKENFDSYVEKLTGSGWVSKAQATSAGEFQQLEKNGYSLNLAFDPSSNGFTLALVEIQE